ncbi:MAG: hypothetical protein MJZ01_08000 [Bacteroidales bacterium]|nr:hypothetical protein [Bacteroidales bacterium]
MKNFIFTFGIALAILAGAVVVNTMTTSDENTSVANVIDIELDLNQSESLCDLVFDKDGNLQTCTTYSWNDANDTKGEAIASINIAKR